MKRFLVCVAVFAMGTIAPLLAWDWFGVVPDEADTNRPPRLHRLLEPANDAIELAEDASLEGDGDKAIEHYREALAALDKVAKENPDRAETQEFTPLRNKAAACRAAIDSIRFAQINQNIRAVTVSDTDALQKKWNKKHGIVDPTDTNVVPVVSAQTNRVAVTNPPVPTNRVVKAALPVSAPADPLDDPEEREASKPKGLDDLVAANQLKNEPLPKDWAAKTDFALRALKAREYALADQTLEGMEKERPKALNVLLLRAAAQAGAGNGYTARRTLERAMRTHPKSYLPYYNLAQLVFSMGAGEEEARQYYELGRTIGGPVNPAIEKMLNDARKPDRQ